MNAPAEKPPAASAEQAADLAALQAAAAGESAPGATGAPGQQPAEIQPPSAQSMALAGMLVGIAKPLICYAMPVLKKSPAELWMPIPEGVAAVLDHYNLGESDLMRNPWARLGFSMAPLAAYAAMNAAEEEKPAEPERLAAPAATAPASSATKNVTFGAPVPAATE